MTKTTETHQETIYTCDRCKNRSEEYYYVADQWIALEPLDKSDTEPTIDLCFRCTRALEEVLKWKKFDLILARYRDQYDLEPSE